MSKTGCRKNKIYNLPGMHENLPETWRHLREPYVQRWTPKDLRKRRSSALCDILPKSLSQFVLSIGPLHLLGHHLQELIELDGTVSILVHLVYHVSELSLWKYNSKTVTFWTSCYWMVAHWKTLARDENKENLLIFFSERLWRIICI